MSWKQSTAFHPSHRLIPSRFPPVDLFDTAATAADLKAAIELAGWTNDRLVPERLHRLPEKDWVYGRPNSSVVMASFLHVAPGGMRFNTDDLGAWYASADVRTAIAEVGHHLRRELHAMGWPEMTRTYRTYSARLARERYIELRGDQAQRSDDYDSASYAASQLFGDQVRHADKDGILFDSIRHSGGMNVAAFVPTNVLDVVQTDHFEIVVRKGARTIEARRLRA